MGRPQLTLATSWPRELGLVLGGHRRPCTPRPLLPAGAQPHRSLSAASNFPCIFHEHQPQVPSPPPWCIQQTQVSGVAWAGFGTRAAIFWGAGCPPLGPQLPRG